MSLRPARSLPVVAPVLWRVAATLALVMGAGGNAFADAPDVAPTFVGPAAPTELDRRESHSQTPAVERAPLGRPVTAPLGVKGATRLDARAAETAGSLAWWLRTGVALAVVVTIILLLKHSLQKAARRSGTLAASLGAGGRAPSGVLEVLGRYPVARGQTLVLLRMDRRVLLLAQTQQGWSTLSEVTGEDDVASLLIKTRDEAGESMSARFEQVLGTLERDPRTMHMDEPSDGGDDEVRDAGPRHAGGAMSAVGRLRQRLQSASEVGA